MEVRSDSKFDYFFNRVETHFEGTIFKEENLKEGEYFVFEMPDGFFSSSQEFFSALSKFVKMYDDNGCFYVTAVTLLESKLEVSNKFDPDDLLDFKENFDITLRYLPEFYFDSKLNWCIYGCLDFFYFVLWCRTDLVEYVNQSFLSQRFIEFNLVVDKNRFLNNQVLSAVQFGKDQTIEYYTNLLVSSNRCIFGDK